MNTKELKSKIKNISFRGCGTWNITILYRGVIYDGITHDSLAIDRIREDIPEKEISCSYTYKQALESLYRDVLIENRLGIYK